MFTGIVEDLGEVETVERHDDSTRIHIRSAVVASDARPGDSICVSGVCLTVTGLVTSPGADAAADAAAVAPGASPAGFTADIMGETLARSSLADIAPGAKVNLERSVRLADRLGGHLVQGHVDGTAAILRREHQPDWDVVRIALPAGLTRYVVHKGSITVDGISLTVSALGAAAPGETAPAAPPEQPAPPGPRAGDWFEVSLIPETLKRTTLGGKQPGELVNLEVDVIAKYVEKLTGGHR